MYADLARRLQRNWNTPDGDGVNHLARSISEYIGANPPLEHEQRLNIDYVLPDSDVDGMVKLCATKNSNDTANDPAIALNIECGSFKFGDDVIDSFNDLGGHWAKATGNWTNVAGNGSYVDCNKASDSTGTALTPNETVRVYLPRAAGKDPNVRTNDVIFYHYDSSGAAFATGYLDDKIGTIKLWGLASGNVPPGWSIMTGAHGGSGLDCHQRFVAGIKSGSVGLAAAAGTTGSGNASISAHSGSGTLSHSFSGSATVSAHAASGAGNELTHAAAAGGADLAHAAAAGGAALAHSGNLNDLAHSGSTTDVAHANGASTDLNAGTYTADFADGAGDDAVKVIDPDFPHSINFANYVADHTDNDIVAAIADHSTADVAGALDDHTKAEVAAALADHTKASVAAAIDDHSMADVAAALADHTIDTSGFSVAAHNGSDVAGVLGNHTDAGHTHPVGTVEPQRINLFLIERIN